MSRRITVAERLRYAFDKTMAAGPIALIGWLAAVSLLVIMVVGLFLSVVEVAPEGGEPLGFVEAVWESLMRTLDPGTMGGDAGWGFRLVMLSVTLFGIFIVSALIGVISAGVDSKLESLRKGRSRILEQNHTIILNWSSSIFDVISQLAIANANKPASRIVVMADLDKVVMEDEIAAKVTNLGRTRVVCRSGDPTDLYDLSIVNPQDSKSIIILSPGQDDPDSSVIKTILALVHDPDRRTRPYRIAAEISSSRNLGVAAIVGGDEAQLVMVDDLIAKIVVHSSRQAGLSTVYSALLDFEGCEIYTAEQPAIAGKTFGDAVFHFETSSLIGICEPGGRVHLNPPSDAVIPAGAQVVVISRDDDTIHTRSRAASDIDETAIVQPQPSVQRAERSLVLGWNHKGKTIVSEAVRYLEPGSVLTVAADSDDFEQDMAALPAFTGDVKVERRVCDTSDRAALEELDVASYDSVMVLGCSNTGGAQSADTRTLVTLLHLRQIRDAASANFSVVSEMIDVRNRELAEVTKANDYVVSNKLVSLMLAQASENPYLSAIFDELLDEAGSEIYMRPVGDYVVTDRPVSFFTVAEAARRRGQVAFGYCRAGNNRNDPRANGGIVINPRRSDKVVYQPGDRIIVLSQD